MHKAQCSPQEWLHTYKVTIRNSCTLRPLRGCFWGDACSYPKRMGRVAFHKGRRAATSLICWWAETLLRGPTRHSSKWTSQRSWWSEETPMQIPFSSLTAWCLSSPLLPQQYRTHFYEEQQANIPRETQPQALPQLWVHFQPETQS